MEVILNVGINKCMHFLMEVSINRGYYSMEVLLNEGIN